MTGIFAGPVKRSVTIAGHQTSISLEPLFWEALRCAADGRNVPLNALVAQIDVARLEADDPPNLASAIRLWLFAKGHSEEDEAGPAGHRTEEAHREHSAL